jgi:hypothetical protein
VKVVRITGTLKCYRLARTRRSSSSSRTFLGHLVLDLLDPLPPRQLWVIEVTGGGVVKNDEGELYRLYKQRSGNLPLVLEPSQEGHEVSVVASVEPWSNGLGGYLSRVRLPT